jgi:hypothetical protein
VLLQPSLKSIINRTGKEMKWHFPQLHLDEKHFFQDGDGDIRSSVRGGRWLTLPQYQRAGWQRLVSASPERLRLKRS